jgi:hypothetical protein
LHCDCSGPSLPPPTDKYIDPNPVCNLCEGRDFNFVPEPNVNKLSNTGCCGSMNCQILYKGAAEGVLSPNLCSTIQTNSGDDCCNLEDIIIPPTAPPAQPRDTCLQYQFSCSKTSNLPCCAGLECRDRSMFGNPICSAVSKNGKTRLNDGSGKDIGGDNLSGRNGVRGRRV